MAYWVFNVLRRNRTKLDNKKNTLIEILNTVTLNSDCVAVQCIQYIHTYIPTNTHRPQEVSSLMIGIRGHGEFNSSVADD